MIQTNSLTQKPTKELINDYITIRDQFRASGGDAYTNARSSLRTDYVNARATTDIMRPWLENISSLPVQEELTGRFEEWDRKIAKGKLSPISGQEISQEVLIEKTNVFYQSFKEIIEGPLFTADRDTRRALRDQMMPELKEQPADVVIQKYDITDKELSNRIKFEWQGFKA